MSGQWKFSGDDKSAYFSPCESYRYVLTRANVGTGNGICVFIGLNPSTATHEIDDPTIRRCIRFTKDWGFNTYVMLNAYAFRSTDPAGLKTTSDPAGAENDEFLRKYGERASLIVAAWGVHCSWNRATDVCRMIGRKIHCLGKTKAGAPKHPLYLKASTKPEVFWPSVQ